jgi:hypothetical protein
MVSLEMANPKYSDVVVRLTGADGNAFNIMGLVTAAMRKLGVSQEEIAQYRREAMSGNYDNLLKVTMQWVTVE